MSSSVLLHLFPISDVNGYCYTRLFQEEHQENLAELIGINPTGFEISDFVSTYSGFNLNQVLSQDQRRIYGLSKDPISGIYHIRKYRFPCMIYNTIKSIYHHIVTVIPECRFGYLDARDEEDRKIYQKMMDNLQYLQDLGADPLAIRDQLDHIYSFHGMKYEREWMEYIDEENGNTYGEYFSAAKTQDFWEHRDNDMPKTKRNLYWERVSETFMPLEDHPGFCYLRLIDDCFQSWFSQIGPNPQIWEIFRIASLHPTPFQSEKSILQFTRFKTSYFSMDINSDTTGLGESCHITRYDSFSDHGNLTLYPAKLIFEHLQLLGAWFTVGTTIAFANNQDLNSLAIFLLNDYEDLDGYCYLKPFHHQFHGELAFMLGRKPTGQEICQAAVTISRGRPLQLLRQGYVNFTCDGNIFHIENGFRFNKFSCSCKKFYQLFMRRNPLKRFGMRAYGDNVFKLYVGGYDTYKLSSEIEVIDGEIFYPTFNWGFFSDLSFNPARKSKDLQYFDHRSCTVKPLEDLWGCCFLKLFKAEYQLQIYDDCGQGPSGEKLAEVVSLYFMRGENVLREPDRHQFIFEFFQENWTAHITHCIIEDPFTSIPDILWVNSYNILVGLVELELNHDHSIFLGMENLGRLITGKELTVGSITFADNEDIIECLGQSPDDLQQRLSPRTHLLNPVLIETQEEEERRIEIESRQQAKELRRSWEKRIPSVGPRVENSRGSRPLSDSERKQKFEVEAQRASRNQERRSETLTLSRRVEEERMNKGKEREIVPGSQQESLSKYSLYQEPTSDGQEDSGVLGKAGDLFTRMDATTHENFLNASETRLCLVWGYCYLILFKIQYQLKIAHTLGKWTTGSKLYQIMTTNPEYFDWSNNNKIFFGTRFRGGFLAFHLSIFEEDLGNSTTISNFIREWVWNSPTAIFGGSFVDLSKIKLVKPDDSIQLKTNTDSEPIHRYCLLKNCEQHSLFHRKKLNLKIFDQTFCSLGERRWDGREDDCHDCKEIRDQMPQRPVHDQSDREFLVSLFSKGDDGQSVDEFIINPNSHPFECEDEYCPDHNHQGQSELCRGGKPCDHPGLCHSCLQNWKPSFSQILIDPLKINKMNIRSSGRFETHPGVCKSLTIFGKLAHRGQQANFRLALLTANSSISATLCGLCQEEPIFKTYVIMFFKTLEGERLWLGNRLFFIARICDYCYQAIEKDDLFDCVQITVLSPLPIQLVPSDLSEILFAGEGSSFFNCGTVEGLTQEIRSFKVTSDGSSLRISKSDLNKNQRYTLLMPGGPIRFQDGIRITHNWVDFQSQGSEILVLDCSAIRIGPLVSLRNPSVILVITSTLIQEAVRVLLDDSQRLHCLLQILKFHRTIFVDNLGSGDQSLLRVATRMKCGVITQDEDLSRQLTGRSIKTYFEIPGCLEPISSMDKNWYDQMGHCSIQLDKDRGFLIIGPFLEGLNYWGLDLSFHLQDNTVFKPLPNLIIPDDEIPVSSIHLTIEKLKNRLGNKFEDWKVKDWKDLDLKRFDDNVVENVLLDLGNSKLKPIIQSLREAVSRIQDFSDQNKNMPRSKGIKGTGYRQGKIDSFLPLSLTESVFNQEISQGIRVLEAPSSGLVPVGPEWNDQDQFQARKDGIKTQQQPWDEEEIEISDIQHYSGKPQKEINDLFDNFSPIKTELLSELIRRGGVVEFPHLRRFSRLMWGLANLCKGKFKMSATDTELSLKRVLSGPKGDRKALLTTFGDHSLGVCLYRSLGRFSAEDSCEFRYILILPSHLTQSLRNEDDYNLTRDNVRYPKIKGFFPEFIRPHPQNPRLQIWFSRCYSMELQKIIYLSDLYNNSFYLRNRVNSSEGKYEMWFWYNVFSGSRMRKDISLIKFHTTASNANFASFPGMVKKYLEGNRRRPIERLSLRIWGGVIQQNLLDRSMGNRSYLSFFGKAENLFDFGDLGNAHVLSYMNSERRVTALGRNMREMKNNINDFRSMPKSDTGELPVRFDDPKTWSQEAILSGLIAYHQRDDILARRNFYDNPVEIEELVQYMLDDRHRFLEGSQQNYDSLSIRSIPNTLSSALFTERVKKSGLSDNIIDLQAYAINMHMGDFAGSIQPGRKDDASDRHPEHRNYGISFLAIKPQHDADSRGMCVQTQDTKILNQPHQSLGGIFNHVSPTELTSKSAADQVKILSNLILGLVTFYANEDMAQWSPSDFKEKFEALTSAQQYLGLISEDVSDYVQATMKLTTNMRLCVTSACGQGQDWVKRVFHISELPHIKPRWDSTGERSEDFRAPQDNRPDDQGSEGIDAADFYDGKIPGEPYGIVKKVIIKDGKQVIVHRNLDPKKDFGAFFIVLVFRRGWMQGLYHAESSEIHDICRSYQMKILKRLIPDAIMSFLVHSDDCNVTVVLNRVPSDVEIAIIEKLNWYIPKLFGLDQSKSKSSISVRVDKSLHNENKDSVADSKFNFSLAGSETWEECGTCDQNSFSEFLGHLNQNNRALAPPMRQTQVMNACNHENASLNILALINSHLQVMKFGADPILMEGSLLNCIHDLEMRLGMRIARDERHLLEAGFAFSTGRTLDFLGYPCVSLLEMMQFGTSSDDIWKMINFPNSVAAQLSERPVFINRRSQKKKIKAIIASLVSSYSDGTDRISGLTRDLNRITGNNALVDLGLGKLNMGIGKKNLRWKAGDEWMNLALTVDWVKRRSLMNVSGILSLDPKLIPFISQATREKCLNYFSKDTRIEVIERNSSITGFYEEHRSSFEIVSDFELVKDAMAFGLTAYHRSTGPRLIREIRSFCRAYNIHSQQSLLFHENLWNAHKSQSHFSHLMTYQFVGYEEFPSHGFRIILGSHNSDHAKIEMFLRELPESRMLTDQAKSKRLLFEIQDIINQGVINMLTTKDPRRANSLDISRSVREAVKSCMGSIQGEIDGKGFPLSTLLIAQSCLGIHSKIQIGGMLFECRYMEYEVYRRMSQKRCVNIIFYDESRDLVELRLSDPLAEKEIKRRWPNCEISQVTSSIDRFDPEIGHQFGEIRGILHRKSRGQNGIEIKDGPLRVDVKIKYISENDLPGCFNVARYLGLVMREGSHIKVMPGILESPCNGDHGLLIPSVRRSLRDALNNLDVGICMGQHNFEEETKGLQLHFCHKYHRIVGLENVPDHNLVEERWAEKWRPFTDGDPISAVTNILEKLEPIVSKVSSHYSDLIKESIWVSLGGDNFLHTSRMKDHCMVSVLPNANTIELSERLIKIYNDQDPDDFFKIERRPKGSFIFLEGELFSWCSEVIQVEALEALSQEALDLLLEMRDDPTQIVHASDSLREFHDLFGSGLSFNTSRKMTARRFDSMKRAMIERDGGERWMKQIKRLRSDIDVRLNEKPNSPRNESPEAIIEHVKIPRKFLNWSVKDVSDSFLIDFVVTMQNSSWVSPMNYCLLRTIQNDTCNLMGLSNQQSYGLISKSVEAAIELSRRYLKENWIFIIDAEEIYEEETEGFTRGFSAHRKSQNWLSWIMMKQEFETVEQTWPEVTLTRILDLNLESDDLISDITVKDKLSLQWGDHFDILSNFMNLSPSRPQFIPLIHRTAVWITAELNELLLIQKPIRWNPIIRTITPEMNWKKPTSQVKFGDNLEYKGETLNFMGQVMGNNNIEFSLSNDLHSDFYKSLINAKGDVVRNWDPPFQISASANESQAEDLIWLRASGGSRTFVRLVSGRPIKTKIRKIKTTSFLTGYTWIDAGVYEFHPVYQMDYCKHKGQDRIIKLLREFDHKNLSWTEIEVLERARCSTVYIEKIDEDDLTEWSKCYEELKNLFPINHTSISAVLMKRYA